MKSKPVWGQQIADLGNGIRVFAKPYPAKTAKGRDRVWITVVDCSDTPSWSVEAFQGSRRMFRGGFVHD